MAQVTSGSVTTNSYDGRYYEVSWTSTQSIANNQTPISWTLSAKGSAGAWYAERTLVVVIGGVTAYSKSERVQRYDGVVATGTRVVNHNSVGDAHIDISIEAAVYTSAVNCTGSGSFDLKNIPRKANIASAPNFTDLDSPTITYSNPAGNAVSSLQACISFTGSKADIPYRDISKTGTSYKFTLTEAEKSTLLSSIPNATSRSVIFYIRTVIGGTTFYSTLARTFTVSANIKPTIALSVTEATAINWGVYVQGNSRLDVGISYTTMYGATIKSYKTTIDGKSYTAKDFTTDILKNSGSIDISSVITDSRGRTATYNGTIEVLPYTPPSIKNLIVVRCNSDGTANAKGAYAKVTYDYAFASIGGKNSLQVVAQYKTKSASAYTTHATDNYTSASLEGTATEIFAVSTVSTYDIQIVATDAICELLEKTSPTATASIGTISTFYSMFKQIGFAFGKVFDISKPNSLQIGWDIYDKYDTQIRNGMAAYNSAGIDANTTLEHHILTQTNTPSSTFHHVITYFYNDKTSTSNRVQMAIPYKTPTVTYHRYYLNGEWSAWLHEGLSAYPVGSYYIAHHDTSPAELFGGSWHRIESRFLWACPATSEIGLTAGEQTHTLTVNEMPSHTHDIHLASAGASGYGLEWSNTVYSHYGYSQTPVIQYAGGGKAHNNMPPYVNVAIWRRTA